MNASVSSFINISSSNIVHKKIFFYNDDIENTKIRNLYIIYNFYVLLVTIIFIIFLNEFYWNYDKIKEFYTSNFHHYKQQQHTKNTFMSNGSNILK